VTFARLLIACAMLADAEPAHAQNAAVAGTVVDARTGHPLSDVVVTIDDHAIATHTDGAGRFHLTGPPGTYTISFRTIGYAVLRQPLVLTASSPIELHVRLVEGAGGHHEEVTVTGRRRAEADAAVAGAILHGRELLTLRGVTLDDPLRAVQALPSATSTDDLYSEFAVRGSSFRHIGLTVDGIPTRYLMHAVQGITDGGSIAMVNSETLSSVSLLPGSYPQRSGRHIGALVELTTREGSRARLSGRAGLSGTSASALAEGPLGNRGSWIASVRRSYLDLLIKRIDPDNGFAFGFTDALGKVVFDVRPDQQLQMLMIAGQSAFEERATDLGPNDEARAISRSFLSALTWRYSPSTRFVLSQRVYATGLWFDNRNADAAVLDHGRTMDLAWRTDATVVLRPSLLIEAGGDVPRSSARHRYQRALNDGAELTPLNTFTAVTGARSVYAQLVAGVGRRLQVTPGVRVDWWTQKAGTSPASPWIVADVGLAARTRLRAGGGVYRQFPELEQRFGLRGNDRLRPEVARHADISLTQALAHDTTVQVTWYARRERDVLWTPGAEPRRGAEGSILLGRGDAPWINALNGHARGVELVVRRESAGGVSGWAAYGYGRHEYTDTSSGERFASDADQRHTVSLYGSYRLSDRTAIGAKFRYGSNYPLTGFIGQATLSPAAPPLFGGAQPLVYALTSERNTLRLPAYARLDIRADRTFSWGDRRVTVFAEVANALNRRNVRNVPYSVDRAGHVFGPTDAMLPIVPSGGLVIEF
jgi:hypothetical protein